MSASGTILSDQAHRTAAVFGPGRYDCAAPFSPARDYPEYRHGAGARSESNPAYQAVREGLRLLGLDAANFGTAAWNPLRGIVRPGDRVVLKPNLVREFRETRAGHDDCVVTHGAVIRAVLDYAHLALEGRGTLVICDAPHSDCDFDAVVRITGLREIQDFYRQVAGVEVEVIDLRPEQADKVDGVIVGHSKLPGDPAGYAKVNLAGHSSFVEVEALCHLLYGSEYDTRELVSHHTGGRHEFLISRTVLSGDCVISIPKLKTHKKTGITVNMKNLVGINGNKNWLPHHREGTPSQGGDQFKDDAVGNKVERSVVAGFKKVFPALGPLRPLLAGPIKAVGKRLFGDTNTDTIRSGNWYGNDTTWRMVIDLNRALHYSDANGVLHERPVRRFFSVVDGIVAGEGNGPMDPVARDAGLVVCGFNPLAVDLACARLMGFDWRKLPVLARALAPHALPLERFAATQIRLESDQDEYRGTLDSLRGPGLGFAPHFGWRGHVELRTHEHEAGAIA